MSGKKPAAALIAQGIAEDVSDERFRGIRTNIADW